MEGGEPQKSQNDLGGGQDPTSGTLTESVKAGIALNNVLTKTTFSYNKPFPL